MKLAAILLAATLLGGCASTCDVTKLQEGEVCHSFVYGRGSTQFWMRMDNYESGFIEPKGWDITL